MSGEVDPWDETPVTVPRGLLALLLNAAGKADEARLLGDCPSDPCPTCTALVEIHEAVYPIQGSAIEPDIGEDVQPPTPDSALVRLHRADSTWLLSVARLEVSHDA